MLSRGAKPVQLFSQSEQDDVSSEVARDLIVESEVTVKNIDTDDENPF